MFLSLPYMIEAIILLSALSVAIGWWQIRRNRIESHKRFMVLGTILAGFFFLGYAAKTIFVGDTTFGGPESFRLPYQLFFASTFSSRDSRSSAGDFDAEVWI